MAGDFRGELNKSVEQMYGRSRPAYEVTCPQCEWQNRIEPPLQLKSEHVIKFTIACECGAETEYRIQDIKQHRRE